MKKAIFIPLSFLIVISSCGKNEPGIREQVINNIVSVGGAFVSADTTGQSTYLLRYPDSLKVNINKSVKIKNAIDKTLNMVGKDGGSNSGLPEIIIDHSSWETPFIKVSMEHYAKHNIPDSSFIHIWIEKK